jgi:hypothetical protein
MFVVEEWRGKKMDRRGWSACTMDESSFFFFLFLFFCLALQGNGMTYWSIAREDNGSLPLNILSVADAMLDWNLCSDAIPTIAFYFDNYILPDGTVNYYTWGPGQRDSVADTGRLIDVGSSSPSCPI